MNMAQWEFRTFGGEEKRVTLVFAFTLCYTGLGAEFGNPYAQIKEIA